MTRRAAAAPGPSPRTASAGPKSAPPRSSWGAPRTRDWSSPPVWESTRSTPRPAPGPSTTSASCPPPAARSGPWPVLPGAATDLGATAGADAVELTWTDPDLSARYTVLRAIRADGPYGTDRHRRRPGRLRHPHPVRRRHRHPRQDVPLRRHQVEHRRTRPPLEARRSDDAEPPTRTRCAGRSPAPPPTATRRSRILNAWSSTLTSVTGNADRFLAAGIYGYQFANAAELMRGYSGFDLDRFKTMMLNVFYPLNNQFLNSHNDACITNYWANWDLCTMNSILAIGILCDDAAKYDQAVTYFKTGAGNGSIAHAVPYLHTDSAGYALGQWQESGRDQGHTVMGMGQMGAFCEMAWSQGDDLYGYDGNRFMKAAQYVAKYNLGQDVPFTTYTWGSGQNCAQQTHTVISSASRGQLRPVWDHRSTTTTPGAGACPSRTSPPWPSASAPRAAAVTTARPAAATTSWASAP